MRVLAQMVSPRARRDMQAARERRSQRPPEDPAADQLLALSRVWADAVADVPYYTALVTAGRAPEGISSWADLHRIPVLTRQHLQDQPEMFKRRSGPPDDYTHTAGSTGTPLQIGMNQRERDLMRVVKLAEWQSLGYTAASRLFLIWGHAHLLGRGWRGRFNHLRRQIADELLGYRRANAYHLSRAKCEAIAEELIQFRPHGVIGYAAALDLFARYARGYRERFRALAIGFVLVTTEAPPRDDTREQLEDLFGCPIVDEYGGGEFGQVAFRRGAGPFEVYSDLNYVQVEPSDPAEPGAHPLLLTSLYQRYTPLIRYRVGDGVLEPRVLPHGHVAAFDRVAGRLTDTIAIADGDAIHSLSIFHCVHGEPSVYNIQMRLTDAGIDILLVTAPGADRAALEGRVRPRLISVHPTFATARFIYVDDVETSRAGKRRWCVDTRTNPPTCAA